MHLPRAAIRYKWSYTGAELNSRPVRVATRDGRAGCDPYTFLSDGQRNANSFRHHVADVLLYRLHHDRPDNSSTNFVQRTGTQSYAQGT
ncbi:hypothetical protein ELS17_06435 [Natrinema altunense]|uniref:Uncharacterized protein n=1 Tax=Natrinema altunense TaxID=222984 RepID=A0A482Y463_9EURY|nr:hypothetical protein ELS17_06435 [Natrinema altunense]